MLCVAENAIGPTASVLYDVHQMCISLLTGQ